MGVKHVGRDCETAANADPSRNQATGPNISRSYPKGEVAGMGAHAAMSLLPSRSRGLRDRWRVPTPRQNPFQNRISSDLSLPVNPDPAADPPAPCATASRPKPAAASPTRGWRVPVTRQAPHCDPTGASPALRRHFARAFSPVSRAKSGQRRCELAPCDPAVPQARYSSSCASASPGAASTQRRATA